MNIVYELNNPIGYTLLAMIGVCLVFCLSFCKGPLG